MFGYVRPFKPEMKFCEMEAYKSVYCALCKMLGREYGWTARITLSYDGTCIALMGAALSADPAKLCRGRCVCNPLKKCMYYCGETDVSYAAAVNVLLSAAKCRDSIRDGSFGERLRGRLLLLLLRRAERKAACREPETAQCIQMQMAAQQALESSGCAIPDAAAEPTAMMTASFMTHFTADETQKQVLHTFGYQLGRWIYLADAYDDLESDLKTGQYNPLTMKFGLNGSFSDVQRATVSSYVQQVLCANEACIAGAYELLELHRLRPIFDNLIYQGLPAVRKQLPRRDRRFKQEELHERSI